MYSISINLVKYLVENGAKINISNKCGPTLLMSVCY